MQEMAVFSVSTTIESMLRPRTVVTAVPYFCWVGLHRSMMRPRTPGKVRLSWASVSLKRRSESFS